MASLKKVLLESMVKDFENIKNFEKGKIQKKECSLLLKRIESAKKLLLDDKEITSSLLEIELKALELHEKI